MIIAFKPAFAGAKNIYSGSTDNSGTRSAFVQLGTWTVPVTAPALGVNSVTPAAAKTYKYTYATASGAPYCDGITLSSSDKSTYAGIHTGSCLAVNDDAGGFAVKIGSGKYVEAAITYTGDGTDTITASHSSDTNCAAMPNCQAVWQ